MLSERMLNTLTAGDCLELLPSVASGSVDLILADLPYGTTRNRWDSVIPLAPLWREWWRVLKPNGAVVLTAQGAFTARLILSEERRFRYKWIYVKSKATSFLNAKKQPLRRHEDVCVFYRKPPTYNPQMTPGEPYDKGVRKAQLTGSYGDFEAVHVRSEGLRYPTDVVYFKTAESEGEVWHATQKPVELGRYLVRTYSNPGETVLDCCFGSGTFPLAALLEGRNFIGFERNEDVDRFRDAPIDYVSVAKDRVAEAWAALGDEARAMVHRGGLTT